MNRVAQKSLGAVLIPALSQIAQVLRQAEIPADLSLTALSVLERLILDGPTRLSDLAKAQHASQPGMTQLVGRLERAGLVLRADAPGDRRGVLVTATEPGREVHAQARTHYAALIDGALGDLSATDRDAVAAAIPALTRLAQASLARS